MLRPVTLQLDLLEPLSGGFSRGDCSPRLLRATQVYHQFLGQDLHLLD